MSKLKTADLKPLIVAHVNENLDNLSSDLRWPLEELEEMKVLGNWKREGKEKTSQYDRHPGCWERIFDCRPYDSQIRAYVITDITDTEVLRVTVVGE